MAKQLTACVCSVAIGVTVGADVRCGLLLTKLVLLLINVPCVRVLVLIACICCSGLHICIRSCTFKYTHLQYRNSCRYLGTCT